MQLRYSCTVSESYWLVSAGAMSAGFSAQVQARNSYGWGALSAAGELQAARAHPAALAAALAALAALALLVAAGIAYSQSYLLYSNSSHFILSN